MSLTVTLAYPPSTNRLTRLANGIAYKPKLVRDWTNDAVARLRAAGAKLLPGDVAVAVQLHPKATKIGKPYRKRVDLDNAIKAALDACQGLVFDNDRQVVRLYATVGPALTAGGLTVTIAPAEDAGPTQEYPLEN